MSEASPGRLIARHPFRSVVLASLAGLVLGRSGTARKTLDFAVGTIGSLGLAIDVADNIVKLVKLARRKPDRP